MNYHLSRRYVDRRAMRGGMEFRQALVRRTNVMRVTRSQFDEFVHGHVPPLTPGVRDVVRALHSRQAQVFLVSGGFRQVRMPIHTSLCCEYIQNTFDCFFIQLAVRVQMIDPIAEDLGIPTSHVYANEMLFAEDGSFRGIDENAPTSRSGGKARVVQQLKDEFGFETIIVVGDGATDAEARPPADAFIGFGGVEARPEVQALADWYVTRFAELLDELNRDRNE